MSAEAIVNLRKLWEKLTFARVNRVIAREPEDVLMIVSEKRLGFPKYYPNDIRRLKDIPEDERPWARISWRHYYGFTDDGVYFQNDDNRGLDCDIRLTMDWSEWGNHIHPFDKPAVGAWICGEVVQTSKGKRFKKWFDYGPAFKLLHEIVMSGTRSTEQELGRLLLVKSPSDQPDKFWAIARLVIFDNVQAFVNMLRPWQEWEPHPAAGMAGDPLRDGSPYAIHGEGMYLALSVPQFVHEISFRLGEPKWWTEFCRLAAEQGLKHNHPAWGGVCEACEEEKRQKGSDSYFDSLYDNYCDDY